MFSECFDTYYKLLISPEGVEPPLQEPESCVISITLRRPDYSILPVFHMNFKTFCQIK